MAKGIKGRKAWGRVVGLALAAMLVAPVSMAKCVMQRVGTLPLEVRGNRLLIGGSINGEPVKFIIDTGAFTSTLMWSTVERFKLPQRPMPNIHVYGVGGESPASAVTVRDLSLDRVESHDVVFLVAGSQLGDPDMVGVLGEDFLSHFDLDFDLAHGKLDFYQPEGCDGEDLVLWNTPYSIAEFRPVSMSNSKIKIRVQLNGLNIPAIFDTGAYFSAVETTVAARLGVTPDSPGTKQVHKTSGIGTHWEDTWVGVFDTFSFGDETIRHAKLRFTNLFGRATETKVGSHISSRLFDYEMLLGADFLRAHRVLISHSQSRIFFSYLGGPVFQTVRPGEETLESVKDEAPAAPGPTPGPAPQQAPDTGDGAGKNPVPW